jgi:hypothetical protein
MVAPFIAVCSSVKPCAIDEPLLSVSDPARTTAGAAHPCRCSHTSTTSSTSTRVRPPSIRYDGKIGPSQVPGARAEMLLRGGSIPIAPGGTGPGVTVANAPARPSPLPCSTRVGGPCRTGCWRRFSWVSRVRRGGWPERWASRAGRVLAGAGGGGIRRCPMSWIATEQARWQRLTSSTSLGTKAKPGRADQHREDGARGGAGSRASPAGGMTTKTGPRASRGAVARGLASATRPAIARSRRAKRQPPSRSKRAVGSIPTQRGATRR